MNLFGSLNDTVQSRSVEVHVSRSPHTQIYTGTNSGTSEPQELTQELSNRYHIFLWKSPNE